MFNQNKNILNCAKQSGDHTSSSASASSEWRTAPLLLSLPPGFTRGPEHVPRSLNRLIERLLHVHQIVMLDPVLSALIQEEGLASDFLHGGSVAMIASEGFRQELARDRGPKAASARTAILLIHVV